MTHQSAKSSFSDAIYSVAEIRAVELAFAGTHPRVSLMQRAGEAVALQVRAMQARATSHTVLILAGPGNNGGDAWVAARALQKAKCVVSVYAMGEQIKGEMVAQKARAAYLKNNGVLYPRFTSKSNTGAGFGKFGIIVDGLFGIGFSARHASAEMAAIVTASRAARSRGSLVLALDSPSGLDADTGVASAEALVADETLTFIALKPGLLTGDAADYCGTIRVHTLGLTLPAPHGHALTRPQLAARRANTHKGSYGHVGVLGGASGMVGAALLAARAALLLGAGKVSLGLMAKKSLAVDLRHPEIMFAKPADLIAHAGVTAIAIGMGAGFETATDKLLQALVANPKAAVIDADALTILAEKTIARSAFLALAKAAKKISISPQTPHPALPFVLTPHPGEAARLLGVTTVEIQQNRVAAALKLAKKYASVVVLKGAGTIIANPSGQYAINRTGNPGMAAGGMGDALAGMIAARLAQGDTPWHAACAGVVLHGAAADACVARGVGPVGLTASDVMLEARVLLNLWAAPSRASPSPP